MAPAERLRVEVAYCAGPRSDDRTLLDLPAGATLADALAASGVLVRHPELGAAPEAGIWGKLQPADRPLRDRDRVEVYRPLQVDPKEARRQRYRSQKQRREGGTGPSG